MIPRDFHFDSAYNLWHLLWLIPLLSVIFYSVKRRKRLQGLLVEKKMQPFILAAQDPLKERIKILCFIFGWIFAVFALMNPLGNEFYRSSASNSFSLKNPSLEVFFLIDVSQSMAVDDGRNKKSRLENAQDIGDQLLAKLKSDSSALYGVASVLIPIVPLTFDLTFLRLVLKEVELNQENHYGTNFSQSFRDLSQDFLDNYPKASKVIIFFSDGGDNVIETAPDQKEEIQKLIAIVKDLKAPIFTVGMGTKEGGSIPGLHKKVLSGLNESLLKEISLASGGEYFTANNSSSADIAVRINQALVDKRLKGNSEGLISGSKGVFHNYFQIPLLISVCFFALYVFFPSIKKKFFLLPFLVSAMQGFATNPGEAFFETGQYAAASEWFAGELKPLPPEWLRNKILYNLGTSLMAEKKWEEALSAFFAVSQEAYTHPLFRLRLFYNQAAALFYQSENSPYKQNYLQEALWLLEIGSSEKLLEPLKEQIERELNNLKPKKTFNPLLTLGQLIRLLRIASVVPLSSFDFEEVFTKSINELPKSEELLQAQKFFSEKDLNQTAFILETLKQKLIASPSAFLRSLLDQLALASALKGQVLNIEQKVWASGDQFYPFLFEWQKRKFAQGTCQCHPWDLFIPEFTEGLRMLLQKPFDAQLFFTYEKWLGALRMLRDNQSSSESEKKKPESDEIRELREMQAIDKGGSTPKIKQEGVELW